MKKSPWKLDPLFTPRSIAVIGASPNGGAGSIVLRNMQRLGYTGTVYPINPKYKEIFGYPCYASLRDLPAPADCAAVLLGNTVSANGSVSRGVCVTDESRNLVSVTERTCIEPYADGIHYSEDGGKSWADLPADCVVSMNLWGFTPAYVQEAKAGFAAFLQVSLPVNPMKCEYYLPTVVTNALEAGKADVHVLTSADKWHGITYREDKPELVEALKKMSEDGLYPVDRLF